MLRNLTVALTVTLGLALAGNAAAQHSHDKDKLWIHVSVDGKGEDAERVRVNLPLRLIEAILPLIEEEEFSHGKIHLDDHDLDHADIVAILKAVTEAEDGEYVTVQDGDETVNVSKKGKHLYVKVNEGRSDRSERVDLKIPVAVLEALVSGGKDELDLMAGIRALGDHAEGDLVTVNDNDGTVVRIWVDAKNSSD
jgi:hypothetical protein